MANIAEVLETNLSSLDSDIREYLITVLEDMTVTERRTVSILHEVMTPFLISSTEMSEEEAEILCRKLSVEFGGSGRTVNPAKGDQEDDETPMLLSAPVRMIEQSDLAPVKATYGGATISTDTTCVEEDGVAVFSLLGKAANAISSTSHNDELDMKKLAVTAKEIRKQRKENEKVDRILKAEAAIELERRNQEAMARLSAIRNAKKAGRQAANGIPTTIFSLPHPSNTGDLLTDQEISLAPSRRYGLFGRNGAGKSTLMRAMSNYKLPNMEHLRVLLVDQHIEGDEDSSMQWLLRADVERTALLQEEANLQAYIHGTNKIPDDMKGVNLQVALSEVYETMENCNVSSAETRAMKILAGLGFSEDLFYRPTNTLSGGWAMRAALGAAIFVKPNLLLLDEPTNHLDLHALVWLERWLTETYTGIAVVVSHDECFLNEVCTDILEFRSTLAGQRKNSLEHHSGDYMTFKRTKADRDAYLIRQKDANDIKREKLREFISREGKKYDNPAHQAQRKMKMKQLADMREVEEIEIEPVLTITLPQPAGVFDKSERLLMLNNVAFGWPGEEPLFRNVDMSIFPRDRIIILGKNGCGKSSFLQLLTGTETPTEGSITRHGGSRITILEQHHYKGEQLDPMLSPIDHLKKLENDGGTAVGKLNPNSRQEETILRGYLSSFGISKTMGLIPVKYLSGGQRMRCAMAVALFNKPDILILDEPTNHLDSDTVRALCDALTKFQGTILAVSHDEKFVDTMLASCGDPANPDTVSKGRIFIMSKKELNLFDGNFRDYKLRITRKLDKL